uniref:Ropporin-1-like protein n=1 Tax=Lygus hesperus TaxID=30085 RepID=A0A0K8SGM8_LYGHE
MPDLVEQMYCSQQIFIPPNLPSILKKYAKAAIRTQPGDLLAWSSAYFRALAEGIPPPAKDRIEYPPVDTPSGLSPGFLKVLINQIGKRETVQKDVLAERWKGVCLNPKALQDLLDVGMFEDDVSWLEFLAICVGTLEPSLTRTMIELCELLTEEPEGGRASIPVTIFLNLYKYLAKLDCGPINRLEQYEQTLIPDTETQCQATDLEPTEGEKEPEDVNIDWDTAIEGTPKGVIESGGDDSDEGIVVEAAETENDENGVVLETVENVVESADQVEQTAEQVEVADTESAELVEAESEENVSVNTEEMVKTEVEDTTAEIVSEYVDPKEGDVSEENTENVDGEGSNVEQVEAEANERQQDESTGIQVEGDANEDEKQEEPNSEVEGGADEEDTGSKGEGQGATEGDGLVDENESSLGGFVKTKDESDQPIDEAASSGEGKETGDAEAVSADDSQLERASNEPAGVDGGQGGREKDADDQIIDDAGKDVINAPEEEEAKSEEANENGQNGEESPAIDDTKDEKVPTTTPEALQVESVEPSGEDGDENEMEVKEIAEEGTEVPPTSENKDDGTAGEDEKLDEDVQEGLGKPKGDDDKGNMTENTNDEDTKDESGETDILADKASQDQAGDAAQDGAAEKDVDLTTNQGEAEAVAAEDNKDEEVSSNADEQQDAANQTAEDVTEYTSANVKEQDNTGSAIEAVIEEAATIELPGKDKVEQTAEDENGNENEQTQEESKLSVEETIDPKSAYIVNDDGTLSGWHPYIASPRAESVQEDDALKGRDSDFSVNTKGSDDGMMVWPDIKPQEKEEVDPEPVLEKEVTSEDGIEEPQEEEQIEGVSEQEENIFAPQIDSFTDLLEAESAPVEETNQEQLAAALQSTELAAEDMAGVIMAIEGVESTAEEGALQGSPEPGTVPLPDGKGENQDQKKEPRRPKKDVEIESLVKKDSDMMLLPTPITSDIMLYMDGVCDKTGVKLCQSQQLHPKMSMIDVQVSVPVDETVVEVFEHHRYPKWMHIPGIGPTVPDHLIEEVEKYFLKIAELQEGMVMPRNIKHFHCPPLELIPECPEGIAEGL